MNYLEVLPDECPPCGAVEQSFSRAYRVVKSNPPTTVCFDSQAKRGRPLLPGADACRHASCSLFTDLGKAKNIAERLPKPRDGVKRIATMDIPADAGKSIVKKKHIDFWFYRGFDPIAAVVAVEEIGND